MRILIIIPTYQEAGNIGELLSRIDALALGTDVLVVDDASPDGTAEIVERRAASRPGLQLMRRAGKLGIGTAHVEALRFAYDRGYDAALTMDADFSHQPEDIPRLLAEKDAADCILTTRFCRPDSLREWSLHRKALTHLGHLLTRVLLGLPWDASGAFRLYRLDRLPRGFLDEVQARDYGFFFESLLILHQRGHRIREVPIDLPARVYGSSKMNLTYIVRSVGHLVRLAATALRARRATRA